ncbi:MAG: TonB C-terminal domain-containing protein [Gammaproteobacteria bacterium]|nr:TonB C-terminal domain-containing protein [Gammaproteobacteria bacterium]
MMLHSKLPILLLLLPLLAGAQESEERRACSAAEHDAYLSRISDAIYVRWHMPRENSVYSCTIVIVQNFRGEILNVGLERCGEDLAVRKSIEDAAYDSSPLTLPDNPNCLSRTIRVHIAHRPQNAQ